MVMLGDNSTFEHTCLESRRADNYGNPAVQHNEFCFVLAFLFCSVYTSYVFSYSPPLEYDCRHERHISHRIKCSDANWSNGSTFFAVMAHALAGFGHPRGSCVWNRSGHEAMVARISHHFGSRTRLTYPMQVLGNHV
jgi:hypothetical protein